VRLLAHVLAVVVPLVAWSCVTEEPPCDPATLASITASCPNEAECNRLLDERQATCAKRIEAGE